MSTARYCSECGTVRGPHVGADEKPCCPDSLLRSVDLDVAEQAAIGFKVDLVLHGLGMAIGGRDEYLAAFAILSGTPVDEIVSKVLAFWGRKL